MKKTYLVILVSCTFAAAVLSGCKTRSTDLETVQEKLAESVKQIFRQCSYDGKYILSDDRQIICQSNMSVSALLRSRTTAVR